MDKNKVSYSDIIRSNIHELENGHVFKNFKEMLKFLGIEKNPSMNSRKAFFKTLERYCNYIKKENSQKIIILEIFEHAKPDINDRSLKNSRLYLPCFYLLLKYMIMKKENHQDKEYYYLNRTKISEIMGLCNEDYYDNKKEYLEENNNTSDFYLFEINEYICKKTNAILQSMKKRELMSFDYIRRVRIKGQDLRDATESETKEIEEVFDTVCKSYNIQNKRIQLSANKERIYADINRILGYESFKTYKIELNDSLIENAKLLELEFNLDGSCWNQVNEHVIDELKRSIYEKSLIAKEDDKKNIAKKEQKELETQQKKESLKGLSYKEKLELYIEEFHKKGAIVEFKYNKVWGIGNEIDIRCNIELLINKLIRIEDYML